METITSAHGKAIASLVLGICAIVCCLFGFWGGMIGVVLGILGLLEANLAKSAGNREGIRTGGFVCSIIGLVCSGIVFIDAISTLLWLNAFANAFL